jgi:methanogen homocitrate synthase
MGYALSKAETDIVLEEIKRMADAKHSIRRDELAELISLLLSKESLSTTQA